MIRYSNNFCISVEPIEEWCEEYSYYDTHDDLGHEEVHVGFLVKPDHWSSEKRIILKLMNELNTSSSICVEIDGKGSEYIYYAVEQGENVIIEKYKTIANVNKPLKIPNDMYGDGKKNLPKYGFGISITEGYINYHDDDKWKHGNITYPRRMTHNDTLGYKTEIEEYNFDQFGQFFDQLTIGNISEGAVGFFDTHADFESKNTFKQREISLTLFKNKAEKDFTFLFNY